MDATAQTEDHIPEISPAMEEGIRLADQLRGQAEPAEFVRWLAAHPEAARELAEFLANDQQCRHAAPHLRTGESIASGELVAARYRILDRIEGGGQGVVYKALDQRLSRHVALKLDKRVSLTPDELVRFRYEAEVTASLKHAHIVQVYDYGVGADGAPYLVMELMDCSLAKWFHSLSPDPHLPVKRAAELVRDIALGVHEAHESKLLHRDLKPGNILLDKGRPRVADFGLARPMDQALSGVAGTAAYMAPEQAAGENAWRRIPKIATTRPPTWRPI